jgi:hypothetical protein
MEAAKLMGELYGLKILTIVALGNIAKAHPNPVEFLTAIRDEAVRGIATAESHGLPSDEHNEYRAAATSVVSTAIDALKQTLSRAQQ